MALSAYLLLAFLALIQASPANCSWIRSAPISNNSTLAGPSNASTSASESAPKLRNTPDWNRIEVADDALMNEYEEKGRTRYSPMFYLKIVSPGVGGPGKDTNPVNKESLVNHVKKVLQIDHELGDWQQAHYRARVFEKEWSISETSQSSSESLTPVMPILKQLPVGGTYSNASWAFRRTAKGEASPHGPNVCYSVVQDKRYLRFDQWGRSSGPGFAATDAHYNNWFNIPDGIIVISGGNSPKEAQPDRDTTELPRIRYWSETTWQIWMNLHGYGNPGALGAKIGWKSIYPWASASNLPGMRNFLNWIVVEGIVGDQDAHRIIKRCLLERTNTTDLPVFGNMQSFRLGHWCFHALLATKSSSQIAYFLGQHKKDNMLGHKILNGVAITSGQYTDDKNRAFAENPTLLWLVEPFSDREIVEMAKREKYYLNRKDNKGQITYKDIPKNINETSSSTRVPGSVGEPIYIERRFT